MRGFLRTAILFIVLTLILVGVGQIMTYYMGGGIALTLAFLAFAVLMNIILYFASGKIAIKMARARIVSPQEAPRLHGIVDRVVLRAGIPKPQVGISPDMTPNAFATGRDPKHAYMVVNQGIMDLLSEEELEGVIAHEISHIKNRDVLIMTVAAVVATVISHLGYAALFARDRNANPLIGLALWILAPIAAMIVQLAISRSREYGADASGARILGHGQGLSRALQKMENYVQHRPARSGNPAMSSLYIVNPFRGGSMRRMFSTHPSTQDRIRRLEELQF